MRKCSSANINVLKQSLLITMIALMVSFVGCSTDLSGIEEDINDLKQQVSALEQTVGDLTKAYEAGKIITSVVPAAAVGPNGGYIVTFSDGSTLTLRNGADGMNGANGSDGADGENGKDGADGKDGENGKDGANGTNGADGENGKDGTDGITPMLKIDDDGYWSVSYDGGMTYIPVVGDNGEPVFSQGADGINGNDGSDGAAGICVRVVIGANGCYVFEMYSPDSPDEVIETIPTPYSSDPSSVVQSIVEDESTGVITMTLADGSVFSFNLDVTYPTSIVVLTDKVALSPGSQSTFEFRINPSNARFIPIVDGEAANLQLDRVGSRAADSYVTAPDYYRIVSVERSVNADGEVRSGQYTVTVEEASDAPTSYAENVVLVLTTKDGRGERIQLSSSLVEFCTTPIPELLSLKIGNIVAEEVAEGVFQIRMPYGADVTDLRPTYKTLGAHHVELKDAVDGSTDASTLDLSTPVTLEAVSEDGRRKEYRLAAVYSNLPTLFLTTPAPITSKEEWTKGCTIDIWNAGELNRLYESVQIKGRGNTTWRYEKKPYAIKLDSKAEVLGMPKHKRWVLLANYLDVTCLRNAASFEVARQLDGLAWTPRGEFVDVVMNGQLIGNYYLCEQIKADPNRVDITEIKPGDLDETSITGGYILELDTSYDEMYKFHTVYRNLPVMFKSPDEDIADEQFNYVKNYFDNIERILYTGSQNTDEVFDYIDMDSFIDWWLVHEVVRNGEPYHPKSCYMYKDRGGKLTAGPVWDFDWGTFTPSTNQFINSTAIWYQPLLLNKTFVARIKERWAANKEKLEQVEDFIDRTAEYIRVSAEGNKKLWPVSDTPNKDSDLPFTDAVNLIKKNYRDRLTVIGSIINRL